MLTIIAGAENGAGSAITQLLFFVVLFGGVFYFLLIRPQRARARKHRALLDTIRVGDRVQTIGGILGTIDSMDDETVVLVVEGGGRLRVSRRALADKVDGRD
ncbi:MAG: preprotein translocase subunit YajC [Acidimicrobiia bacterium]